MLYNVDILTAPVLGTTTMYDYRILFPRLGAPGDPPRAGDRARGPDARPPRDRRAASASSARPAGSVRDGARRDRDLPHLQRRARRHAPALPVLRHDARGRLQRRALRPAGPRPVLRSSRASSAPGATSRTWSASSASRTPPCAPESTRSLRALGLGGPDDGGPGARDEAGRDDATRDEAGPPAAERATVDERRRQILERLARREIGALDAAAALRSLEEAR